jgi:transportin-3
LRCAGIPDKEIAGITLHFWYRFVMGLEDLEPYEYRQIKIDHFAPQLVRLLAIFTNLLRFPMGVEDLSSDRVDDIEGIRLYFADTLEDCCRLLGGGAVLQTVGGPLQEECRRVSSLPAHQQLSEWHGIEAHFYAVQAVSMYIPSDENRVMPFVMGLIPQLPPEVPLLRATACQTVGRYASWLGNHPSFLQPLLPYLAQGLSIPRCASASAVAIREISERCSSLDDAVMQLYDGIVVAREQHRAAGSTGEDFILDIKNELAVLEGVCKAVSNKLKNHPSLNHDVMNGYINHLAQPIIANLKVLASPEYASSSKQLSSEICRLTVLIQHLRLSRPSSHHQLTDILSRSDFILGLMRETWSMLDAISQKCPRDFVLSEKLCRLHKHAIRECGAAAYAPLLDPLLQQITTNFSLSLSSPYLYLASICIAEYGRNPTYSQQMFNMVANLSSTVFQTLRTTDDFTAHPDVVEEFFYMAGRMVNNCPAPLVQSNLLNSFLQCAAIGMKLSHRDANKGTLNFLESTVSYSLHLRSNRAADANDQANMAALESAIVADGQPLVINLAQALLGELPASRLDSGSGSIAGVLFYMNQLCPDLLMQWIQPPLVSAPDHAKVAFFGALHNRVTRDEFNSSVRKFTSVCERSRRRQAGNSGDTNTH